VINEGDRQENSSLALVDVAVEEKPIYSEDEIRRMNSLPEEAETAVEMVSTEQLVAEKAAYEQSLQQTQAEQNQLNDSEDIGVDKVFQIGPVSQSALETLLSTSEFKMVLSRSGYQNVPEQLNMVWDEGRQEAWLTFSGFASEQRADEWQAWLESVGFVAQSVEKAFVPMGDVYQFYLAEPLQEYSVEIDRHESITMMLHRMRSAEVLWFQAFQKINAQPVLTSLNWSNTDNRYHLIVVNVESEAEQSAIWSDLTAVGLLPALAEP